MQTRMDQKEFQKKLSIEEWSKNDSSSKLTYSTGMSSLENRKIIQTVKCTSSTQGRSNTYAEAFQECKQFAVQQFSTKFGERSEITRSVSAGSGWTSVNFVQDSLFGADNISKEMPKFPRSNPVSYLYKCGPYMRFKPIIGPLPFENTETVSGKVFNCEKVNHNYQMSRSLFEYPTKSSFFRFEAYMESVNNESNRSESESEDDDDSLLECSVRNSITSCDSFDNSSITLGSDSSTSQLLAIEGPPDFRKEKSYRTANELLTTERSYVGILHLLDQVFQFRVDHNNRAYQMFPEEMVHQIFSNIKSIYHFHHDFMLPRLEERMSNWENERKIGDIMKNFAPFLKMYSEYATNFDNSRNIITALITKNQKFADIINEIQQMPECRGLPLVHHMLSPIQRVPRYELLLKEYLKRLPENSSDKEDTEQALHLVSVAANHSNDTMKKIDRFKQLLEIQENINGIVDLVSPTRELLKEGKILKISARSGDHQERYLFLFTDILLLCSQRLIPNKVISGPLYRLRARFEVERMEVSEGDNLETANTFYIRDSCKNVELYTQTPEELTSWLDALYSAGQELSKRKSSLKISADQLSSMEYELGKTSPNLCKTDTVSKCMDCSANFSVMKRKHHCRACGLIFCSKCCMKKIPLSYDNNKVSRVCKQCYEVLSTKSDVSNCDIEKENISGMTQRGKGVLEVPADSGAAVLSDYLQLKVKGSWVRRWFSLHSDFVLYSFHKSSDKRALTATPLPGFMIVKGVDATDVIGDKTKVFKMYHTKKMYYFQANSKTDVDKWVFVLERASRAELPPTFNSDR